MANLLLSEFKTPFTSAPFSKIEIDHFLPAFEKAIEFAKKEIDEITNQNEKPTFENTLEKLEFSGQQLNRISSIFFNLNSAETNEEIQNLAQKISPMLAEFGNDIRLNAKLFQRIKEVYTNKGNGDYSKEQETLLEKNYKAFSRNGANLNNEQKEQLREIDNELTKKKLLFGENILAETNSYELLITEEDRLKGLPESAKEAAKIAAEEKNKKGWLFSLDYPSYIPFMTYLEDRNLRKEVAIAFGSRAFQKNKSNNEQNVLDIANLRYKRARLLGYETHAHFVLEERMAKTPDTVLHFLNDLLNKAKPAALSEFKELESLAKKDGIDRLEKWDAAYYSEKLKKQRFDFNDEVLKPYFKLENVIDGVFKVSNLLFDLHFEEISNIDTYHKDVKTYKVSNEKGEYIALLYADFFPRPGKRNGAWMTSFKSQWKKEGHNSRPHISIVCNFTKPTKTKPSLLTFNEVTTLFHEFGHALHGMLANTTYPNLSGTSVYWDFVELPSQLLENWCYEEKALNLFSRHFETQESIPMDYIQKIKDSSNFLEGIQTLRQLSFGVLDMNWHGIDPSTINDVKTHEQYAFKSTSLYPDISNNCMSTAFSHIFQGGYSAGYYSYKWAEVLDADAFELFLQKGIFDKDTGQKFKSEILEKGGTEQPMTLYKNFKGAAPNNKALLKRAGLIKG